jgi:multicomponent Na+:H+ antiporter subunit G
MIDWLVIVFLSVGALSFLTTTIGILRFPDFYTRMHAAGKGDVFSSLLMLVGLALYNLHHFSGGALLVSLKIIAIIIFIFMASPTATHAILDAGYESGAAPWTKDGVEEKESDLGA